MKNYDNFFIPVTNLNEAQKFYEEVLNLKMKFNMVEKGMLAFNVGDEEPAIILKDISKFPKQKPTIWFEVENTQIAYDHLREKGVDFLSEPFMIGTGYSAEFKDPWGNSFGITDYSLVEEG